MKEWGSVCCVEGSYCLDWTTGALDAGGWLREGGWDFACAESSPAAFDPVLFKDQHQ